MTEKLIIKGGIPLKGEVSVTGAKNAAVAILPAAVLSEGICVIDMDTIMPGLSLYDFGDAISILISLILEKISSFAILI